jgi:hypothetical protein
MWNVLLVYTIQLSLLYIREYFPRGVGTIDSISTLREPMKKLDDMELLVENEGTN